MLDEDKHNYIASVGKKFNMETLQEIYQYISEEMNDMRKHSAVSDLLQGLTNGRIDAVAGHNLAYWSNNDNLTSEAFAHMFEAQFDDIRYKEMKEVFPNSLKYFENMLKEVLLR